MSIPKVVGIEQEYAIKIQGADHLSAFDASCMLISSYARSLGLREPGMEMLWDYGHETPFQDIRGKLFGKVTGQQVVHPEENRLINSPLPNGARLYTDHAHPEYSTPECMSAKQAVVCDKSGEKILMEGIAQAGKSLPLAGISLFKNNTDYMGHSYGCHENYLMEADVHEAYFVDHPERALKTLVPFLVTRQIYAGAGKIGTETTGQGKAPYQISQRADFMEAIFGLETMYARPLINTRGEHHADPERFRRLHLILGDANMCEFAGFLKIGSTQIVLQMIEDGFLTDDLALKNPLRAIKQISTRFATKVELADGRLLTAIELQKLFLDKARQYQESREAPHVPDAELILSCWDEALNGLESLVLTEDFRIEDDPMEMTARADWLLKLWLINRYRLGKNMAWDNPQLRVLDLKYHNIDPEKGIFYHLQDQGHAVRIIEDAQIDAAIRTAPTDTRAWFRGKCIEKLAREIYLTNWEVVGFDQGDVYRVIPLLNPLKGTQAQFEEVFKQVHSAKDLLTAIGAG